MSTFAGRIAKKTPRPTPGVRSFGLHKTFKPFSLSRDLLRRLPRNVWICVEISGSPKKFAWGTLCWLWRFSYIYGNEPRLALAPKLLRIFLLCWAIPPVRSAEWAAGDSRLWALRTMVGESGKWWVSAEEISVFYQSEVFVNINGNGRLRCIGKYHVD